MFGLIDRISNENRGGEELAIERQSESSEEDVEGEDGHAQEIVKHSEFKERKTQTIDIEKILETQNAQNQ